MLALLVFEGLELEDSQAGDVMTMSAATTTWRLVRPNGRPSRCLLSEIAGHTDVIVWNGPSIVLWERHQSLADARHRADELWTVLVAYGCEPAVGEPLMFRTSLPFRRSCPDCQDETGRVRHRRGGYLVVECERCGRTWNAQERSFNAERRLMPRTDPDRRHAAA